VLYVLVLVHYCQRMVEGSKLFLQYQLLDIWVCSNVVEQFRI